MQRADKNKITRRSISALRSFEKSRFSTPFSLSCLRTGPLAPFAPNDGFRRSLRFARLGTRLAGRRGVILNEKGASARYKSRASSAVAFRHAPAGAAAAPFSNFSLWRVCLYGPPFLFSCGLHICKNFLFGWFSVINRVDAAYIEHYNGLRTLC